MRIDKESKYYGKERYALRNTATWSPFSRYLGIMRDIQSMVHLNGAMLFNTYEDAKFLADGKMEHNPGWHLYPVKIMVTEDVD